MDPGNVLDQLTGSHGEYRAIFDEPVIGIPMFNEIIEVREDGNTVKIGRAHV